MANQIPKIVFAVDLSATNDMGHLNPDMHTESSDAGRSSVTTKTAQRRIMITGLLPGNQYEVMHGKTITEYGQKALYLLNTYGPSTPFRYLTVISRSDTQQ